MSYYTGRWLNKDDTQTFTGPLSAYLYHKNKNISMILLDCESSPCYSHLRYDMVFLYADELFNLFNSFGVPNELVTPPVPVLPTKDKKKILMTGHIL
jgi:hypothetical protein